MYTELLRWIALDNLSLNIQKFTSFEDALFIFISKHRLEIRVLNKLIKTDLLSSFSQKFQDRLFGEVAAIQELCNIQRAFVNEIQNRFPEYRKPIIIKGSALFAITSNQNSIRRSGDIDIFFDDTELLKKILVSMDFFECKKECAAHEDSIFFRDNLYIEIHNSFPCLKLPNFKQQFGNKNQRYIFNIETSSIVYSDLICNAIRVNNKEFNDVLVTSFEMSALISCAHIFKDYTWEPYKQPLVRFVEVLEIYDLFTDNRFNQELFCELVERFQAQDCVGFAIKLLNIILDYKAPQIFNKFTIIPFFKLTNDTFGPYYFANDDFIRQIPILDFNNLVESLIPLQVEYTSQYNSEFIENTYRASTDNKFIDFSFNVRLEDHKLKFRFELSNCSEEGQNFFVCLENGFSHFWIDNPTDTRTYGNGKVKKSEDYLEVSFLIYPPSKRHGTKYGVIAYGKSMRLDNKVTVIPIRYKI